jgi:hypothetical protein
MNTQDMETTSDVTDQTSALCSLDLPAAANILTLYGPALSIQTQGEADFYFEALVERRVKCGGHSREEAQEMERSNLAMFAGESDSTGRERVERLFHCAHPFFGAIAACGVPSPLEAYRMGGRFGEELLGRQQSAGVTS